MPMGKNKKGVAIDGWVIIDKPVVPLTPNLSATEKILKIEEWYTS